MRKLALPLLVLVLASLASAQTAYTGTPTFCINAESCSYSIAPSGAVALQVTYVVPFPNAGESVSFSGQGQVFLPGDHQWSYFQPQCPTAATNCSPGRWSGTITYDGPGNPAYYYAEYHIVGTFSGSDTSPGPNYGTTITGTVDMSIECHASKCHPDPDGAGGLTVSN
jgi:hypothetical protein